MSHMLVLPDPVAVTFADSSAERFNVLIVGGWRRGLEAALALRELGGERIATTMIAPNPEFVYRPMTVREPFGYAQARRYPLDELARDIGVELHVDSFNWLDPELSVLHTEACEQALLRRGLARSRRSLVRAL